MEDRSEEGLPQTAHATNSRRCGLVLEGGALRGLFTAGVIDAWLDARLTFDGLIGVSAGACFGANYKSRQPGRVIRYSKRFARESRYCSWRSLLTTGDLFGAEFCYHTLPDRLDPFDKRTFATNPMEFHVVATDCATGQPVYRRLDRADWAAFEWIRASASMPLVAQPVPLEGGLYLDGGLSDGIPIRYFESLGYTRNVVIATRPHGYRKRPLRRLALLKPFLRKLPAIYDALRTRHVRYNETLEQIDARVRADVALLIAPPEPLPISRVCHDPDVMQRVYDIGHTLGMKRLGEVKEFLRG